MKIVTESDWFTKDRTMLNLNRKLGGGALNH